MNTESATLPLPVRIGGRGLDKYWAIAALSFRQRLDERAALWGRVLFYAMILLIYSRLWQAVLGGSDAASLGDGARVIVGIPERHLLTAASLRPGDEAFADLFAEFVIEQSGAADEPIDRRVFEIVDGRLVEFAGVGVG